MTASHNPIALGGRPLCGDHIIRMVYLDESGTGDPRREPFIIVAAVIIHVDTQWKAISKHLTEYADFVVPPEKRGEFKAFHAKELFSGGKIFERKEGQYGYWWPLLDEILSIPKKYDLPIAFGFTRRSWFEAGTQHHASSVAAKIPPVVGAQMLAFTMATIAIEHWMKHRAGPDEVAQMVMENNPHAQKFIHAAHRVISNPRLRDALLDAKGKKSVNISRIMWPIYFQDKIDSSMLQIADACAWAIRRRLSREKDSERFYAPLRGQFINDVSALLEPDEAPSIEMDLPSGLEGSALTERSS